MNYFTKNRVFLLLSTVVSGVICMLLRFVMMVFGCDDRGLLISMHFSVILCWAVAAVFLAGLVFGVRRLGDAGSYEQLFPASAVGGTMVVMAGVMLLVVSLYGDTVFEKAAGAAAGASMICTGSSRFSGKKPAFICNFLICVFFVVKLIGNYRIWSADPQLQDYAFQMLACVMLMLAAFHRVSADADAIHRKRLAYTCLAAGFLCIVSLSDPENPVYYGACSLWALSSTGLLEPVAAQQED